MSENTQELPTSMHLSKGRSFFIAGIISVILLLAFGVLAALFGSIVYAFLVQPAMGILGMMLCMAALCILMFLLYLVLRLSGIQVPSREQQDAMRANHRTYFRFKRWVEGQMSVNHAAAEKLQRWFDTIFDKGHAGFDRLRDL